MKNLLSIAFGVVCGLLGAGVLFLLTRPPTGQAIELRPIPTPLPVIVHVSGAVSHPGVYILPQGSRVQDAIQSAGGFLPEANDQDLNLAAFVTDGEQLVVKVKPPTPAPTPTPKLAGEDGAVYSEPARPTEHPNASSGLTQVAPTPAPASTGLININTATLEELDSLPSIGPVIAQRIIDYRTANGPFTDIEAIMKVFGIGPATYEKIKDLITVES